MNANDKGVLAVLDDLAALAKRQSVPGREERIREARAAVAELVEAALTCAVHAEDLRDGIHCRNEQETARVAIDVRALRAALARVGGAK